jgi:hypothetical protein
VLTGGGLVPPDSPPGADTAAQLLLGSVEEGLATPAPPWLPGCGGCNSPEAAPSAVLPVSELPASPSAAGGSAAPAAAAAPAPVASSRCSGKDARRAAAAAAAAPPSGRLPLGDPRGGGGDPLRTSPAPPCASLAPLPASLLRRWTDALSTTPSRRGAGGGTVGAGRCVRRRALSQFCSALARDLRRVAISLKEGRALGSASQQSWHTQRGMVEAVEEDRRAGFTGVSKG